MVQEEAVFPLCERLEGQGKQDCVWLRPGQIETGLEGLIADTQENSAVTLTSSPSAWYSQVRSHFAKQPPREFSPHFLAESQSLKGVMRCWVPRTTASNTILCKSLRVHRWTDWQVTSDSHNVWRMIYTYLYTFTHIYILCINLKFYSLSFMYKFMIGASL